MNIPKDLLPALELSALASSSQVQLVDTCRIGRKTSADDGQGSQSETWAETAESVAAGGIACRLFNPTSVREVIQGGSVRAIVVWKLQLPLGTDIGSSCQVDKGGQLFEVLDTDAGLSYAVFLTVFLVRVRNQTVLW